VLIIFPSPGGPWPGLSRGTPSLGVKLWVWKRATIALGLKPHVVTDWWMEPNSHPVRNINVLKRGDGRGHVT
jgi:hypothetical protein